MQAPAARVYGPIGGLLATLWRGPWRAPRLRRVSAVGGSDTGVIREHNEDYFLIADLARPALTRRGADGVAALTAERPLLVVADGMGGAAGGEVASATAANVICGRVTDAVRDGRLRTGVQVRTVLSEAFAAANRRIRDCAARDTGLHGMGTTATAAAIVGDRVYCAHVGDSRAYLVRDGRAQRLTTDHSLVQALIDAGAADELEAQDPRRHALVRALGTEREVAVDTCHVDLREGDTVLLCTDGLWSTVDDDELARRVSAAPGLPALCEALLALANDRGGRDNATLLAARFDGGRGEPGS